MSTNDYANQGRNHSIITEKIEYYPLFLVVTLHMDEHTITAMITQAYIGILPTTIHNTDSRTLISPLESVVVHASSKFISLIDVLNSIYSARAPRIPLLRRDYMIQGP